MFVNFKVSRKDFEQFLKNYYFRKELSRRLLLLIFLSLLFSTARNKGEPFILSTFVIKFLLASCAYFFLLFILPYFISTAKYRKHIDEQFLLGTQKIILAVEGIHVSTVAASKFWRWETIKDADIIPGYLSIRLFAQKLYIIPLQFFVSENEAINFLGVMKANIAKFKGGSAQRKVRNLYYWGLLGFVPNIGAITGIVLIFRGFQYKEIKLMLIGAGDILLTVLYWTLMIRQFGPGNI